MGSSSERIYKNDFQSQIVVYINLNAEHAVSIVDLMIKLNVKAREPKLHREFRAVPSPYRILPAQKTLWSVAAEDDDVGVERH